MVDRMIKVGERFGVPVMLLVALLFFAREMCVSIHATLIVPMVKSHVEFLESTSETLERSSITLRQIEQTEATQAAILSEISLGQRAIQSALLHDPTTGALE